MVKMRGFLYCLLASLLLSVARPLPHPHVADHEGHTEEHFHHLHHGKDESHPDHSQVEEICHKLSSPNADFAFALYKHLNAKAEAESKNVFFSPLGISTALSLLSMGAKGDTHKQLFQVLGYSDLTSAQVSEAYEHLQHMLGHSQGALQLDTGSTLVLQEGFKPTQKYLEDAKHYFQAEGFTVDFKKQDLAIQEINKYIAKKTHDKIPEVMTSVESDTLLVLLNYIFFRGKWEKPFDPKDTHKADFHVDDTTKVTVDMMMRTGLFEYYYDRNNHTEVLMLPYQGNASMMILLPSKGKIKHVESIISKEYIRHWHKSLFGSSVDVFMPKFSASGSYSLKEVLTEMGVVAAFSDSADLSGISEEVGLKVSKVSHKAVLNVDERGTEAAAATTIEIVPESLPDRFVLDRPFLLLIVEESTRSILFMGKVVNPTAS
ncbi:hypothetical protein MATL_G00207150 [Megalops atlanticus]|uniref:Serpin domain-containing protein n=1 Tax=Megalops atlanticus TaxID=7932 RepID=A0A9D3PKN9_MEGAT|nr:hypothetical protein MATL_G00207150 [Megalops atlanticus]